MFRPCANQFSMSSNSLARFGMLGLIAFVAMLSACSSTSKKVSSQNPASVASSKPTQETAKADSRVPPKVDTTAITGDKPGDKKLADKKGDKKADKKSVNEPEPIEPASPPPIPPEATQQFEKALTLLGAGDYAPAAKEFQRLSEQYPNYSGPLTNLGIVYAKTGKLADAEKTLKSATQRGEPSAAAFNQLGIVYRKLGKFKEADEAYSQAIKIDNGYALAHLNLGVLCDMYLGQPQRALSEFERYLQLTPNPDSRVAGWIKELQGRVGKPKSDAPASAAAPTSATSGAKP